MRTAYALLGILWVIVIAAALFAYDRTAERKPDTQPQIAHIMSTNTLILSSPAFEQHAPMPARYTCDAGEVSPPLSIAGAPAGTKSFVLIMEDPDVPKQLDPKGTFLHWVLFDIPGDTRSIGEGASSGVGGANETGETGYVAPCPPKGYEPTEHRYIFSLYALDAMLGLEAGASREEVVRAMEGHVLDEAQLTGRYRRS